MAKEVIFLCGDLAMPWGHFMAANDACKAYGDVITGGVAEILRQYFRSVGRDLDEVAFIQEFGLFMGHIERGFHSIQMIATAQSEYYHRNQPKAFYDIVRYFRYADATDPRDKIFALLGLASEQHCEVAALEPDYEISLERLYYKMARIHVKTRRNIDFLGDSCGIHHPPGFSSWMPHWGHPSQVSMMRYCEVGPEIFYFAAALSDVDFVFSETSGLLTLEGFAYRQD